MRKPKSLKTRLDSLTNNHRVLDEKIKAQYKCYAPDEEVEQLKIQKLRIKDEISSIKKILKGNA